MLHLEHFICLDRENDKASTRSVYYYLEEHIRKTVFMAGRRRRLHRPVGELETRYMLPSPSACPNGTAPSTRRHVESAPAAAATAMHRTFGKRRKQRAAGAPTRDRKARGRRRRRRKKNTLLSFSRVHAYSPSTTYHLFLECVGEGRMSYESERVVCACTVCVVQTTEKIQKKKIGVIRA